MCNVSWPCSWATSSSGVETRRIPISSSSSSTASSWMGDQLKMVLWMICPFSNCTLARTPSQSSFSSLHSPRKNTATNLKKKGIQTFPDDNYQSSNGFWKGWSYYTSSCLQSQLMTKIDSYEKTYSWSPIKFGSKLTHIGFTEKTYSWSSIKLLRISSVTSSTTADAWFLRSEKILT